MKKNSKGFHLAKQLNPVHHVLKVESQNLKMKFAVTLTLSLITVFGIVKPVNACSPCGGIVATSQGLVGTNLVLDLVGSPGWSCQYTMMAEIVCSNTPFNDVATHSTTSIDAAAWGSPYNNIPFPQIIIDVSAYCPGTYDIQVWMNSCGVATAVQLNSFTIPGAIGLGLTASATPASICPGSSSQLSAAANAGCGGGAVNFTWTGGAGISNPNIANPTASPAVTTTYTVTATAACYTESVDVTVTVYDPSPVTASAVDDICSTSIGEVTANPDPGGVPNFTYYWPPPLNANTQTVVGVPAGQYTVEMTDGNGCVSTDVVDVGDTPADFQGSTTLVSCPGGNDGTAFAEMIPPLGNITYQWDDPNNQQTQTATGLSAGPYTCTITSDVGCVGVVNVDVTEIPGMIGNIINQSPVTCNSGSDGMIEVSVNQGTPPYSYSWDNSSSVAAIADDLPAGQNICTVTDANGCTIDIIGVLNEPPPLEITFLTPDTQICPEDDIELEVTGQGGSSPYTFTWYENGTKIGTGTSIIVDPDVTNTQYCVELSEACGSPTDTECTLIYFPTPIIPNAIPDQPEKCVPDLFEFYNTSSNPGEIATTHWQFDKNITHFKTEIGDDSTSWYYQVVGTYDVIMTITSIYGCVYTDTIENIINVLPNPVADFGFSVNPTTIFQTEGIQLQDKSSYDVIDWQYFSPGSIPMSSVNPNPTFDFPQGIEGFYPITLIVTTELGCTDTVVHDMQVISDVLVFAPNAFTPDGDEYNQTWNIHINGIDVYDFDLFVFNRWGEIVWESNDASVGWDGTYHGEIVQAGTYTWKAVVKRPYVDERITFEGFVSVLK